MTNQQKLQAEIDQINAEIAERQELLNRRQTQLDALPKERVRLRARQIGAPEFESLFIFPEGDRDVHLASVVVRQCHNNNIDPAALAAHICAFNAPTAHDLTREHEALEVAAREWIHVWGTPALTVEAKKLSKSLAALDAAGKGGA